MNFELQLLRFISTNLPAVRGVGLIPVKLLIPFYKRKKRNKVRVNVFNRLLELDPLENVDNCLLFYPQLCDRTELAYLRTNLKSDSVFIDIGANIGMYSFFASNFIKSGSILAIEADPYNFQKLQTNLSLNSGVNINALNIGVSDKMEILDLYINNRGNRGGNSFLDIEPQRPTIGIKCVPLLSILIEQKIEFIDGIKIDIEGFEYRVLKEYFNTAPDYLHPRFIILEYHEGLVEKCGGSSLNLLKEVGYKIKSKEGVNYILEN